MRLVIPEETDQEREARVKMQHLQDCLARGGECDAYDELLRDRGLSREELEFEQAVAADEEETVRQNLIREAQGADQNWPKLAD